MKTSTLGIFAFELGAISLAACGARSGFETSGQTSAGGGGASSTATIASGSASSTTTGASSSSAGGATACGNETENGVGIDVLRYQGDVFGCGHASPEGGNKTLTLRGQITSASNGLIEFDECSPAADCIGKISQVRILANTIGAAYLPINAFVDVRIEESNNAFACLDNLLIKNVDNWDGAPNPAASGDATWLAASATGTAFADAGYTVEAIPLGCYPSEPATCGKHEDFVFRVGANGESTDVPMGSTAELTQAGWIFSNLASYSLDVCDAPPHFAYVLFVPQLD